MAEREKAAPEACVFQRDERIKGRDEARVEARGRVREESWCGVNDGVHFRGVVRTYIAALLLVEPGRIALNGVEASAGHHHVCGIAV